MSGFIEVKTSNENNDLGIVQISLISGVYIDEETQSVQLMVNGKMINQDAGFYTRFLFATGSDECRIPAAERQTKNKGGK